MSPPPADGYRIAGHKNRSPRSPQTVADWASLVQSEKRRANGRRGAGAGDDDGDGVVVVDDAVVDDAGDVACAPDRQRKTHQRPQFGQNGRNANRAPMNRRTGQSAATDRRTPWARLDLAGDWDRERLGRRFGVDRAADDGGELRAIRRARRRAMRMRPLDGHQSVRRNGRLNAYARMQSCLCESVGVCVY